MEYRDFRKWNIEIDFRKWNIEILENGILRF
jgi:hypothetical protein